MNTNSTYCGITSEGNKIQHGACRYRFNNMKIFITYLGLITSVISYGQVEYFEYNNPNVIEVTEEKINLLTSKTWYGYLIVDYGRHDTIGLAPYKSDYLIFDVKSTDF